jgi:hypothetical protein
MLSAGVAGLAWENSNINSVMTSGSIGNAIGFTSGESGYIGFQFKNTSNTICYGWAEIILTEGGSSGTIEVVSWAYEDSGAAILVGSTSSVPEPASARQGLALSLLARQACAAGETSARAHRIATSRALIPFKTPETIRAFSFSEAL